MEIVLDNKRLIEAFEAGPELLNKHLNRAIGRVVREIARDARKGAPKASSVLANSISQRQVNPLTGEVFSVVDYARMVEEGTGPGGWPPPRALLDWIRVRRIQPRRAGMDEEELAYLIGRSINRRGTPAQPYMQPALEDNRARATRRFDDAIDDALREISRR